MHLVKLSQIMLKTWPGLIHLKKITYIQISSLNVLIAAWNLAVTWI